MNKNTHSILWKFIIFTLLLIIANTSKNVYAIDNDVLTNTTRVYFCSEITKKYGNGDCILLENYDADGNKIYGLIDAGRKINTVDENGKSSTVVKEFLKRHGVEKLEFLAITHSHGDHNGDAVTVLDNFEVGTIYMKEYDQKWALSGNQALYEDIIEKAISKDIKVVGVSYLSLVSNEVSPSRSNEFINNIKNAKEEKFQSFYYKNNEDTNIIFNFGSAKIQIFNWEMFDEEGNQYITGITTNTTREIDDDENNNSIALLVTQGNKRALFTGDMNNLDEDEANGRIGDEDRLKYDIGKIDLLKLGHHGYQYSNTENYMNVLKPEYAIITNDVGGAYKDISNWLEENNVNYLYTTSDEYAVSATITDDEIYLGFETTGTFKNINGSVYYIPDNDEYKYADYTKVAYKVEYCEQTVEVSSWGELKEVIEDNKNLATQIDNENRNFILNKLIINLKSGDNWTATETIEIEDKQQIFLTTSEDIKILRGTELKDSSLFLVKGSLNLGTDVMQGKITLDGNKENVESSTTLIRIESGKLNIYDNVTLCNNMNKATTKTSNALPVDYTSFGSAIYASEGNINMYGGCIINNSQDVVYTYTLPKEVRNNYRFSTLGTGIYMTNNSVFNMYNGIISNNDAQNHSVLKSNSTYTNTTSNGSITQTCAGIGIYSCNNSEVNLLGGSITDNSAINNAITNLSTSTDDTINTNIYSLTNGIYGVGIDVESSKVTISNNFLISNNTAELNAKITIEDNTYISSAVNAAIRGLQGYIRNSTIIINEATISNGSYVNNAEVTNNGKIGKEGTSNAFTSNCGGGLDFVNSTTFTVDKLTVNNCTSQNGGGIYIHSSSGNIYNSNISNNTATSCGGGIWIYSSNVKIENTILSENEAEYGGAIYNVTDTNTELNNITITDNKTNKGSGGGIYAYGNLIISGDETIISNNNAYTYGGGIMVKSKTIINAGEISDNVATLYAGGGIRVDGILILNGGTIKNNSANTTGGGVDHTKGIFYFSSGTIEDNTAIKNENDIYPIDYEVVLYGDINDDENIDITDLLMLKRHIIADSNTEWELLNKNLISADINGDGDIDVTDLILLKRRIVAENKK